MTDLRDMDGRCLICGKAEPLTCDEERHALVKQRGWINHSTYEGSHLADEPCPGHRCRQEPAQPQQAATALLQPDPETVAGFRELVMAVQAGAASIAPWRRGNKGPVEWLVSVAFKVPGGGVGFQVLAKLPIGPAQLGWVPLDPETGMPLAPPTGSVQPPALGPKSGAPPPEPQALN